MEASSHARVLEALGPETPRSESSVASSAASVEWCKRTMRTSNGSRRTHTHTNTSDPYQHHLNVTMPEVTNRVIDEAGFRTPKMIDDIRNLKNICDMMTTTTSQDRRCLCEHAWLLVMRVLVALVVA